MGCETLATLLSQDILPIAAVATMITGVVIVLGYYLGIFFSNPKISVWAKTELIQLFVSIIAVMLVVFGIEMFCSVDASGLAAFAEGASINPISITDAAEGYMADAAVFTHYNLMLERYYLGGFDLLSAYGRFKCDYLGVEWSWITCLFGNSGYSYSPHLFASYLAIAHGVAFSNAIFSYLSALNFLFILRYSTSGIALFLLPLAVILRATPYMRHLGSLFFAVCISFLMVYPFLLAMFYVFERVPGSPLTMTQDSAGYLNQANVYYMQNEGEMEAKTGWYQDSIFPQGIQSSSALMLSGKAFIIGVFIPTICLLAAVASVRYVSKFLGEDIDLSRISQMV